MRFHLLCNRVTSRALALTLLALAALLCFGQALPRPASADTGGSRPRAAEGSSGSSSTPVAKITGQYAEICACERLCESILIDTNRRATCSIVCALKVEAGHRGEVSLAGVTAAIVAADPASAGKVAAAPLLYVDRSASAPQVEAIRALLAERFAGRLGITTLTSTKLTSVKLSRSTEAVAIEIEGIADLRGRPLIGSYRRPVQVENAPNSVIAYPCLGRGIAGQVADLAARVRFDAEGRSVLYGKFDFGPPGKGKR